MPPSEISNVPDAVDAIEEYLKWRSTAALRLMSFDAGPRRSFEAARKIIAQLDVNPGPGPVVRAVPDEGAPYIVGPYRVGPSSLPSGRTSLNVRLPGGSYGPALADAVNALSELVANVPVVQALAVRASICADIDASSGGRARQARQLRSESTQLLTFAGQLQEQIPELGDLFLDQWRSDLARRSPSSPVPAPPVIKPIQLRHP